MILPIPDKFVGHHEEPTRLDSLKVQLSFRPAFITFNFPLSLLICDIKLQCKNGLVQSIFAAYSDKGVAASTIHQAPLSFPKMVSGDYLQILVRNNGSMGMHFSAALHGVPAFKIHESRLPGLRRALEIITFPEDIQLLKAEITKEL